MKSISEYYCLYDKLREPIESIKIFSIVHPKHHLVQYLKKEKTKILKSINFAFFESDEPYILSTFRGENSNYIHINTKLINKLPDCIVEPVDGNERKDLVIPLEIHQYENWLAIFGTFAILLDVNIRLRKDFDDIKPYSIEELLRDNRNESFLNKTLFSITQTIYYDDNFRMNLQSFINKENKSLKFVYQYGYDFLLSCFKAYHNNKIMKDTIKDYININDDEFKELYAMFETKIALEI